LSRGKVAAADQDDGPALAPRAAREGAQERGLAHAAAAAHAQQLGRGLLRRQPVGEDG
jgi:hypothetical protein